MSLADVLHPIGAETFFADYHERKPLLISRAVPTHFRDLLIFDDIDRLLAAVEMGYPEVALVNAERKIDDSEYSTSHKTINLAQLYRLHGEGATIILNHLDRCHPPLAALCGGMGMKFSAPVQTNIYVTPPHAKGFKAHFDTHDVFVLQVHGSKTWRLYGTPVALPLESQFEEVADGMAGAPSAEMELKCGDTLYIPRGLVHDAVSRDDTSIHITVGVLSYTWSDFMVEALAGVVQNDPAFRRSMPAGFARPDFDRSAARQTFFELMRRFADSADSDAAFDAFVQEFVDQRRPHLRGQMVQVGRLTDIGPDSIMRRRPDLAFTISEDQSAIYIRCHGNEISIPASAAAAVRFVLAAPEFKVSALPGLDATERLILVRRLVREGILLTATEEKNS